MERWLNILPTVLGVAALLGSAVVVLRDRVRQSTIDVLQENNSALGEKIDRLEDDRTEHQQKITTLEATIEGLQRENLRLGELLQGKAEIRQLESLILDHHRDILADRERDRRAAETWSGQLHNDLRAILSAVSGRSQGGS